MAEDHGFQSQEGHRLCANNCGFFGSPATQNLCSKCYRDLCLKQDINNNNSHHVESSSFSFPTSSSSIPSSSLLPAPSSSTTLVAQPAPPPDTLPERVAPVAVPVAQNRPNRCFTCNKKVALTGFKCRCGTTFCGTHRYPEQHGCTFDFKTMGKEAIARANPVIKGMKLEKI